MARRRMIRKKKTEGQIVIQIKVMTCHSTLAWSWLVTFISQWLAWHTFNVGNVAIIVSALYQYTTHCP